MNEDLMRDMAEPIPEKLARLSKEMRDLRDEEGWSDRVKLLRFQIREIGWRLNQEGGATAMQAACDAAEDIGGADTAGIIDHAWDEIGSWFC